MKVPFAGRPQAAIQDSDHPGVNGLEQQLERLSFDGEVGRVVRDGLARLPQTELAQVASDLKFALDALKPALAQLHGTASSTGLQLGRSVTVKGDVEAAEDLLVDGRVEGSIRLPDHVLIIGATGSVKGEVVASTVVVHGLIEGPVRATEKVDLRRGGRIAGDIGTPRIAISEGAEFQGSIDVRRTSEPVPAAGAEDLRDVERV